MMITETVDKSGTTDFYQVQGSIMSDVITYTYSNASQDDVLFVQYLPSSNSNSTQRMSQNTTTATGTYNIISYKYYAR